jgi:hypothetical protein
MGLRARHIAVMGRSAIAAVLLAGGAAFGAQSTPRPDFSPTPDVSWIAYGNSFMPLPGAPHPVENPPDQPYIVGEIPDPYVPETPEFERARRAAEPANGTRRRIADLSNPILKPWVRDTLKKFNDDTLAGKLIYNRQVSCWPIGTPGFLLYPVQPVYFIQGKREVVIVWQSDHQLRRVYLNVPHRKGAAPSWYGDSVGHYEGDTLVVDTTGITTKVFIDNYRTPHSDQLHTVERFHLIDGGKTLEVRLHVEDPIAFTTPWDAIQLYRRVEPGPMIEVSCAENNINPFHQAMEPMPEAKAPDF